MSTTEPAPERTRAARRTGGSSPSARSAPSCGARAFQVTAGILVVGIIAMIVITSLLSGRDQTREVAVVDPAGTTPWSRPPELAAAIDDNLTLEATTYDDVAAAEQAVRDGDVAAALLPGDDGYDLVGDDDIDTTIAQAVAAAVSSQVTGENAAEQGVDLEALTAGAQVQQRLLDPDADNTDLRQAASFVFVILFYLTALTFGMSIAVSVTQEKESRVVEILAAAVPIRALLWGKVIGTSVLAIGQTLVLAAAGVIALIVSGNTEALTVLGPRHRVVRRVLRARLRGPGHRMVGRGLAGRSPTGPPGHDRSRSS